MAKKEVLFSLDEKGVLTVAPGVTEITQLDVAAFPATDIKEVVIPDSVTKIGKYAFIYTDLEKVVIPESVTVIEDSAFKGTKLKNVVIPKSVTKIDWRIFEGSSLEEVKLPLGLTEIGYCAFKNTKLKSIEIPETVTEIDGAFGGTDIEELKIPKSVTKIGSLDGMKLKSVEFPNGLTHCSADFENCTELESVVLPDCVEYVSSFKGCTSLKSVTLSKNIKSIRRDCFKGCSLEKIELPEGLEKIENNAFGDSQLKEVNIPSTVTEIFGNPFEGENGVIDVNIKTKGDRFTFDGEYLVDREKKTIVYVRPTIKEFRMPEGAEYMNAKVSFKGFKSLEVAEFPETLLGLDNNDKTKPLFIDFSGCTSLKRVKLPTGAQVNLDGCTSLEKLIIPSSFDQKKMNMTGINADIEIYDDSHLDYQWTKSKSAEYDGRILSCCYGTATTFRFGTGRKAIYVRPVSTELVVDDSIYIFNDTAGLDNVERIVCSYGWLVDLKNLKSVELRDGSLHLSGCTSLKDAKISGEIGVFSVTGSSDLDIKTEGKAVYDGTILYVYGELNYCQMGAEHVVVPEGITKINGTAFRGHTNLKSVVLPSTLKKLEDGAFEGCTSLESLTIPAGCDLEEIPSRAFSGCTALESITIPEKCKTIRFSAFTDSGIKKLTIHKGVEYWHECGHGNAEIELEEGSRFTYEDGVLMDREGTICYIKDADHIVIPKSAKSGVYYGGDTFMYHLSPNVKSITLMSGAVKVMEAFNNIWSAMDLCERYKELDAIYIPASLVKSKVNYLCHFEHEATPGKTYRLVKPIVKAKKK